MRDITACQAGRNGCSVGGKMGDAGERRGDCQNEQGKQVGETLVTKRTGLA